MQNDRLDGTGHDGLHPTLAGRNRERGPRQAPGECSHATGSTVQPGHERSAGLYRRLGRLSQEYHASLSRESQTDSRTGTGLFAGLAGLAHWDGDQADREKRVVEVTRTISHGNAEQAEILLKQSAGGSMLNTAFIERLNGTMRERLATLTRKCRHGARRLLPLEKGMYLVGCTYNFCWAHQELSKPTHTGSACTPAMAAGLTDHIWSILEVLQYKVPPSPWIEPKRHGRPKMQTKQTAIPTKRQSLHSRLRPLVRLRKGGLCSTTGMILLANGPAPKQQRRAEAK
jgi:hypothetical protein